MIYILLFFTLIGISPLMATAAETFSCKDIDGVLHIADNLMNLPPECRDQAKTSDLDKDSGSVNYVPTDTQTGQVNHEFNQAVNEADREIEARKRQAANMVVQAQNLAASFENAVLTRKAAVRSKEYGTRDSIIAAEQQMQAARAGKKALLAKLNNPRLSTEQQQQIEGSLARITD